MNELRLANISVVAADRIRPFFLEILEGCPELVHSLYVTGSASTPDFHEKSSDVNSVVILHKIDFDFFRFLAPLGKKYGSKGLAAPLVMTPSYISESLDVFPMEFLELKLVHETAYGQDILNDNHIEPSFLRLQCEREVKTRLMGLRQGYISALGEPEKIAVILSRSVTGCIPLFRAIITLLGSEPPCGKLDVISIIEKKISANTEPFTKALLQKERRIKDKAEILSLFESYYANLEAVSDIVNALEQ